MFKLSLSQFLFEQKIDGYHLYKRIIPFNYIKVLDGSDKIDLIKFITQEEFNIIKPIRKKDAKNVFNKYDQSIKSLHLRHINNPIEQNLKYGYGTFSDFIAEYTKYQLNEGWMRDPQYPESHFIKNNNCRIHCHYIMFDGIHMILKDPTDFIKFIEWEQNNIIIPDFSNNKIDKWDSND